MIQLDNSWSLFLDRDGVINVERDNDYVYEPSQFHFYDGVLTTLSKCNSVFKHIVIATNQRGIGRGLMSHQNLGDVHNYMLQQIQEHNGRIDHIYYAPDMDNEALNRKPNTGMADQAKADFVNIDFTKSIMVGNNVSDMDFGKRKGMTTVFLNTTSQESTEHPLIDYQLNDLSQLFTIIELTNP